MRYRLYRTDYRIWQETKPPPKMSGSGPLISYRLKSPVKRAFCLTAQAERSNEILIILLITAFKRVQQVATLTDHGQQAAA